MDPGHWAVKLGRLIKNVFVRIGKALQYGWEAFVSLVGSPSPAPAPQREESGPVASEPQTPSHYEEAQRRGRDKAYRDALASLQGLDPDIAAKAARELGDEYFHSLDSEEQDFLRRTGSSDDDER